MSRPGLAAIVALVCAATGGLAADGQTCNGASVNGRDLRLGRVLGIDARVNFIAGATDIGARAKDCPSASAACRRNAFVVSADSVLVDDVVGAYACVTFVSPRGVPTGGWLPAAQLDIKPAPAPKLADWAGKWKRYEAEILLKVRSAEISAEGEATWGGSDPRRVANGAVHSGSFDGKAKPRGNMLAFGEGYDGAAPPDDEAKDYQCRVRLRLLGPYLVAEDNRNCGGANVSFIGAYVRETK